MRRIAVLDDEKAYLVSVSELLAEYEKERDEHFIVECFCNPSDFLDKLDSGVEYDIYLLDIYMPGITGMSVAVELRKKNSESSIIFLTSSPDFALQAFGVNATHYLLKPYNRQDFFAAMDKAFRMIGMQQPKTILLKTSNGYQNISVSKIIYCESENHNQRIILLEGEPIYTRISSAELCEKLATFGQFYPCGKTYIINLGCIDKLQNDVVVMENGDSLSVPRRVITGLKNAYLDYMERR